MPRSWKRGCSSCGSDSVERSIVPRTRSAWRCASVTPVSPVMSSCSLAICKSIVLTHGGRIQVRDRPGGGACFSVFLPAQAPYLTVTNVQIAKVLAFQYRDPSIAEQANSRRCRLARTYIFSKTFRRRTLRARSARRAAASSAGAGPAAHGSWHTSRRATIEIIKLLKRGRGRARRWPPVCGRGVQGVPKCWRYTLHRGFSDKQFVGDLTVRGSGAHQAQDLTFAISQLRS